MDGEDKLGALLEEAAARPDDARLSALIGRAALEIALRAARSQGLRAEAAEDVAQASVEKFLRKLAVGEGPRSNASAFVWRTAENAARDLYRRRGSDARRVEAFALEASAHEVADAEALWLRRESGERAKRLVREALSEAPASYRVALEKLLDGVAVEFVADENYAAMVRAGDVDVKDSAAVARARKKARNLADQHLSRGRVWLRKKILAAMSAEATAEDER